MLKSIPCFSVFLLGLCFYGGGGGGGGGVVVNAQILCRQQVCAPSDSFFSRFSLFQCCDGFECVSGRVWGRCRSSSTQTPTNSPSASSSGTMPSPIPSLSLSSPPRYLSCQELIQEYASIPSGTYEIWPHGESPVRAYCDMETDGGGWTLVGAWAPLPGYAMLDYATNGIKPDQVAASFAAPRNLTNAGPAHYSSPIINSLFHNGTMQYLVLTGTEVSGWVLVKYTKTNRDLSYDAFQGVCWTAYTKNNGFTALVDQDTTNTNPLPYANPSWTSQSVTGRSCGNSQPTSNCLHYLPDDITEEFQWLFRENDDDTPYAARPNSDQVPSLIFIR